MTWLANYLRVGGKYICTRPGPREGELEGILVGILRQLNWTAVYYDHSDRFGVGFPLEVEKEIAFQHKPASLKSLVQLAALVQVTLLVDRSRSRYERD